MKFKLLKLLAAAAVCAVTLQGCLAIVLGTMEPDQRAKLYLIPPDKSAIYFYRDDDACASVALPVAIDGVDSGQIGSKTYVVWMVNPGQHTITSSRESSDSIALDVRVGMPYFVAQKVECGPPAHSQFQLVGAATGKARVRASAYASNAVKTN